MQAPPAVRQVQSRRGCGPVYAPVDNLPVRPAPAPTGRPRIDTSAYWSDVDHIMNNITIHPPLASRLVCWSRNSFLAITPGQMWASFLAAFKSERPGQTGSAGGHSSRRLVAGLPLRQSKRAGAEHRPFRFGVGNCQRLEAKRPHRPVTVRAAKAILSVSQIRKGCTALAKAEATTLVWSTQAAWPAMATSQAKPKA